MGARNDRRVFLSDGERQNKSGGGGKEEERKRGRSKTSTAKRAGRLVSGRAPPGLVRFVLARPTRTLTAPRQRFEVDHWVLLWQDGWMGPAVPAEADVMLPRRAKTIFRRKPEARNRREKKKKNFAREGTDHFNCQATLKKKKKQKTRDLEKKKKKKSRAMKNA